MDISKNKKQKHAIYKYIYIYIYIFVMAKNAMHQLMKINIDFTVCYHNEFVQKWEVKSDYDIQCAN